MSGFMEMRYKSRAVGNVYRFQLGALAVFSTGVQLLAGGKVLSAVTGIPFFAMTFILSMIAFSYSQRAGIVSSVKTNAVQMLLMLLVAVLAVALTFTLEGPETARDGLAGVSKFVGLPVFAFGSVADIPEMKVAGSVLSVGISGAFALLYTKGAGINEDYQSKR